MKNIRFYAAKKYDSSDYEKVEDMIYKTKEIMSDTGNSFAVKECSDKELAASLLRADGWTPGTGDFLEDYLILAHAGKRYYREIENVNTDEDIVFEDPYDSNDPKMIYVTSVVFEPEPELGENEPTDSFVSQYPLEDILDKFFVYCYDDYSEENASDQVNSYVEFASDDIADIRGVLSIIGKHVYNKEDGDYVLLKIE